MVMCMQTEEWSHATCVCLSSLGQVFLSLLSTRSATSKYCKDELALAYVSSKPIFPCMIEPYSEVTQVMDFGM